MTAVRRDYERGDMAGRVPSGSVKILVIDISLWCFRLACSHNAREAWALERSIADLHPAQGKPNDQAH